MNYPGESIRKTPLAKGREIGDVRIMDYDTSLRPKGHVATTKHRYLVVAFCPYQQECVEGDTPKTVPTRTDWCDSLDEASDFFSIYLARAKLDGWQTLK